MYVRTATTNTLEYYSTMTNQDKLLELVENFKYDLEHKAKSSKSVKSYDDFTDGCYQGKYEAYTDALGMVEEILSYVTRIARE